MAFEEITSFKNPLVKKIASLRERSGRRETGLTIVEGERETSMALKAGVKFEKLVFVPELARNRGMQALIESAMAKHVPIAEMSAEVFAKISFGDRLEGVIGVVRPPQRTFADLKLKKNPLVVVTEHLEKPGNLGAILRTCDAAGVDAVIACEEATDLFNPNVIRASLGAIFALPVIEATNKAAFEFLKKSGVRICGTFPDGEKPYSEEDCTGSVAFVLGSEQEGLSSFWQTHSNSRVKLPMTGRVNSLNVSAAAAIVVYEALRQREK